MTNLTPKLLALGLSLGSAQAVTVFALTADDANSDPSAFTGSVAETLDDAFAYDPLSPTTPLPQQSYNPNSAGFHGSGGNGAGKNLSYTLDTAFSTNAGETSIIVDLYGRNEACCFDRDNDIDVILYNGDYTTPVATISGLTIDGGDFWVRADFDSLPLGTTIDRFRIVGNDSDINGANNYFTLMETRAAGLNPVPEPGSTVLAALAGLAFIGRRRRNS